MMKKISVMILALSFSSVAFAGANIEAGKKLATEKCVVCHSANFNEPTDPSYPKLAGQHKDYLAQAIKAYKRGASAANGRNNGIMEGQVKDLSNADIENIAAYLHSLPGSLVLKK